MTSRAVLACVVAALAGCSEPGGGGIDREQCLARVESLAGEIAAGAGFDAVNAAHKEVKAALDALKDDDKKACEEAYARIKGDTEVALRRENLSVMGWIMAFFAAGVLWGGCAACIAVALKATKAIGGDGE